MRRSIVQFCVGAKLFFGIFLLLGCITVNQLHFRMMHFTTQKPEIPSPIVLDTNVYAYKWRPQAIGMLKSIGRSQKAIQSTTERTNQYIHSLQLSRVQPLILIIISLLAV
uniref:Uncharacterized protein n=1 Tax=Bionectria ochroleuca TaxID=29856 RepID=A0A8H7NF53_BIOOC